MPEIGASLREARLRAKVDITDVEAATKIRAKYLRALENEEWGLLPGPAFVKSFLRTYADYLGLDGKLLVDEYKLRHERPTDIDQMPISPNLGRRRTPGPVSRISPAWIIGIVIVALLGLFAYLGASGEEDTNTTPTTSTQSAASKRAEAKRKAEAAAAARRRRIRRQRVKLRIEPTAALFVCLENAKGKTLIPGQILQGGAKTRTFSSKRFRITLGHGGDSTLRLNGKAFAVPASDTSISFVITRRKRQQLPAGTGPTCGSGATTTSTATGAGTG
ncbi:MAG: helix-turn-helix domain-containing protein [Solirubrobacteraceae bacterium]